MQAIRAFSIMSFLAFGLAACGGSSEVVVNGSLSVNNGTDIQIGETVAHAIPVALNGSVDVKALAVNIASSDPSVATVYPKTCYLSSTTGHHSCLVFLRGRNDGKVSITASAAGYASASSKVTVSPNVTAKALFLTTAAANSGTIKASTPNYGQLQISSFPSANAPSTSNFAMTAMAGDTITLATSIAPGFDTPLNGVPIFLSVTGGASIVGNAQCNVDSNYDANHYCLYKIQLPSKPQVSGTPPQPVPVVVTATAVGNNAGDFYNTPTATITMQNNPVPGQIVLQGTGAGIPLGMSSPFWVVLQDSSGVSTTLTVTLSASQNSGLTINPALSGSAQTTCTLSSASPVCGFGVLGASTSGSSPTINASESTGAYPIPSLPVSVSPPETSARARTITFQNNAPDPVWVGITGGTATSFLTSQRVATFNPQTNGANVSCGPSNPAAACPAGSTCRQGGAKPGPDTVYYCYWDQPTPSNGYQISSTSQSSTSVSISDSSYDPISDIIWSGNFYPRQGCTTSGGVFKCAIADCGNGTASQACAPGTGGSPGIATLAEVTLQANNNDYYDVSIIGGANVKTTFGPDKLPSPLTANGYSCGTAGLSSAQNGLSGSDWDMVTHIVSNPTTGSSSPYSTSSQTNTPSTAYYHYIQSPSSGRVGTGCASQKDPVSYCEALDLPTVANNSQYVCGYDQTAVNNGSTSDYVTSCGTHLAWLSANAVFALNTAATNTAPFPFATTYTTSAAGTVSLSSLYQCNNSTNKSGYASNPVPDASTACGCTNWGDSSLGTLTGDVTFSAPIAAPTQACSTNNQANSTYYWTQNVLPTIAWLKQACPTCYTYPFDDMSSTFQCGTPTGLNSVAYLVQYNGNIAGK